MSTGSSAAADLLSEQPVFREDAPDPARFCSWRYVPDMLKTHRQWGRHGRRVPSPRPAPAGVVLDGIALYHESQTRPYHPRPQTLVFLAAAEELAAFVNPRRDHYHFKDRPAADLWPETKAFLSQAVFEDACRGKDILAAHPAGDTSRWYCLDLDNHDRDAERFLARLAAVLDAVRATGDDMFLAAVNPADVSGVHVYGFGPADLPLADVLAYANGIKRGLVERHPDLGFEGLEVYPCRTQPLRLPVCKGRIVILDRPLEGMSCRDQTIRLAAHISEPVPLMPTAEVVEWFRGRLPKPRKIRPAAPPPRPAEVSPLDGLEVRDGMVRAFDEDIDWLVRPEEEWYRWIPVDDYLAKDAARRAGCSSTPTPVPPLAEQPGPAPAVGRDLATGRTVPAGECGRVFAPPADCGIHVLARPAEPERPPAVASPTPRPGTREVNRGGRGVKVEQQGRFCELQDFFWSERGRPADDTIGAYLAPHARFALAFGCTPDDILAFYRERLPARRDGSFSDQLSRSSERSGPSPFERPRTCR